jgi:hypothetical protein
MLPPPRRQQRSDRCAVIMEATIDLFAARQPDSIIWHHRATFFVRGFMLHGDGCDAMARACDDDDSIHSIHSFD